MARKKRLVIEGATLEAVELLAESAGVTPGELIVRALRREDEAQREQAVPQDASATSEAGSAQEAGNSAGAQGTGVLEAAIGASYGADLIRMLAERGIYSRQVAQPSGAKRDEPRGGGGGGSTIRERQRKTSAPSELRSEPIGSIHADGIQALADAHGMATGAIEPGKRRITMHVVRRNLVSIEDVDTRETNGFILPDGVSVAELATVLQELNSGGSLVSSLIFANSTVEGFDAAFITRVDVAALPQILEVALVGSATLGEDANESSGAQNKEVEG